jgi:hypothetical protein
MSEISGYPQQMPSRYENWLPRFTGNYGVRYEDHIDNFLAFFQLHRISDDVEDLAMKLFSSTFHSDDKKWYDSLPDASITSMDQLEETFLEKWNIKIEDIHMLINRVEYMKQTKNETIKEFHTRFEYLLQQIPRYHHPEDRYPVYLYINALLVQLVFLVNEKGPRTIQEDYHMAIQIEENITLFKIEHLFSSEIKVDDPKDTLDTLIMERLVPLIYLLVNYRKYGSNSSTNKRLWRGILMKVSNPMRNTKNLLILLPRIMRTWSKREKLKVSNMMIKN